MNARLILGVILSILALFVFVRLLIWTAAAMLYIAAFVLLFALGFAAGWLFHGYRTYRSEKQKKDSSSR